MLFSYSYWSFFSFPFQFESFFLPFSLPPRTPQMPFRSLFLLLLHFLFILIPFRIFIFVIMPSSSSSHSHYSIPLPPPAFYFSSLSCSLSSFVSLAFIFFFFCLSFTPPPGLLTLFFLFLLFPHCFYSLPHSIHYLSSFFCLLSSFFVFLLLRLILFFNFQAFFISCFPLKMYITPFRHPPPLTFYSFRPLPPPSLALPPHSFLKFSSFNFPIPPSLIFLFLFRMVFVLFS